MGTNRGIASGRIRDRQSHARSPRLFRRERWASCANRSKRSTRAAPSMAFRGRSVSRIRAMPSCRARCRSSRNSASGLRGAAARPSIRTSGDAGSPTNRAWIIRCLIPSAGDARPDWTLDDFKRAADQARDGRIAVLQFHGVPDREHPWVHTRPERFEEFMRYLHTNAFKVIALRDLARYVDPEQGAGGPAGDRRKAKGRTQGSARRRRDRGRRQRRSRCPARIYIRGADGAWHFPKSRFHCGSAIRYERRSGFNTNAVEMHTTLSAHPFRVELLPGRYTFTIERGKEFFPETREVDGRARLAEADVSAAPLDQHGRARLVFRRHAQSSRSRRSAQRHAGRGRECRFADGGLDDGFDRRTDRQWSRVSAEILAARRCRSTPRTSGIRATPSMRFFAPATANHTLGALLILNHRTRFDQPVFPLARHCARKRARKARCSIWRNTTGRGRSRSCRCSNVDLFELANNHHWQTEYGVKNWAVPAPAWMGLSGSGTDNERDWTLYGFQTYYALLNCGFRLRPAAGTANGVHPVPLGFSRVYVHLDEPFSFDAWMRGLAAGRSFVTTGPMILAKVDGQWPGATFPRPKSSKDHALECTVLSEQPLETIELIVNGVVTQRFDPQNTKAEAGSFESRVFNAVQSEDIVMAGVALF